MTQRAIPARPLAAVLACSGIASPPVWAQGETAEPSHPAIGTVLAFDSSTRTASEHRAGGLPRARLIALTLAVVVAGCETAAREPGTGRAVRDSAGIRIVESEAPLWTAGRGWRIDQVLVSIGAVEGPETQP